MALTLTACVTQQPKPIAESMAFEPAIRALTVNLLTQLKANQSTLTAMSEVTIAVDPMVDTNTAEVTVASRRIEQIISDETRKQFPKIKLVPLNPETVESASYMLNGMIKPDLKNTSKGPGTYRVGSSIVDLKTNTVMASTEVRIAEQKLDVTPVSSHQDNPMYTKDSRTEGLIKTVQSAPGEKADKNYMDGLSTSALLSEGDRKYDEKNFEKALSYYKEATLRPDGQIMRTYAAMYQAYRKLGKMDDAEVAFGRLAALGYRTNNLSAKIMFSVGNTQFMPDPDLRNQYAIWLRQIAKLFAKADNCLSIVGHSSRSGNEAFNESLSLQRAQQVQKLMQKDFPNIMQRSTAVGRGWKESIVGSGSDDLSDAIDRRVEFKITPCR